MAQSTVCKSHAVVAIAVMALSLGGCSLTAKFGLGGPAVPPGAPLPQASESGIGVLNPSSR